ncbi:MAG: cob(I)yrinic acid a,c-diamide adenosyltransferase [Bacteroidia bacterium]|nr:cob(I)yrinic acid a,c-diamide adenosyltransferase [Bacteroidia bacterium]
MAKIYTKSGDKGKTSLVGGTRVKKTHIRLEAYGTIDELNSFIGWLNCEVKDEDTNRFLVYLQHKLFTVGSYLATETEQISPKAASIITDKDIERVEQEIDKADALLPKLNRFIIPGGNEPASRAHICRTICRRAERNMYRVTEEFPVSGAVLKFINRLSDYFFVIARYESYRTGKEIYWEQDNI